MPRSKANSKSALWFQLINAASRYLWHGDRFGAINTINNSYIKLAQDLT